jgi:hypothetical protein
MNNLTGTMAWSYPTFRVSRFMPRQQSKVGGLQYGQHRSKSVCVIFGPIFHKFGLMQLEILRQSLIAAFNALYPSNNAASSWISNGLPAGFPALTQRSEYSIPIAR